MNNFLDKLLKIFNRLEENKPNTCIYRYGIAIFITSTLIIAKIIFNLGISNDTHYLFLFLAVAAISILGGIGPGILSTSILSFVINLSFNSNGKMLFQADHAIIFLIEGTLLSILIHSREYVKKISHKHAQELAVTLESIGDGVISTDCFGKIQYMNRVAEKITGWGNDESWGIKIGNILSFSDNKDSHLKSSVLLKKILKKVNARNDDKFFLKSKNGSKTPVDINASYIRDSKGEIQGTVFVLRDITEKNKAKIEKFISAASHELKTPVTSMKLLVELLKKKSQNKNNKDFLIYLSKIDTQLNNITELINDLLDLSKIQTGELKLYAESFDLNKLISETVSSVQYASAKNKIKIEGKITQNIIADKNRISQVLINLLTNAIKYSPNSDQIFVKTKTQNDRAIVSIQDFGIGIPSKDKKRVFQRFYRVNGDAENTFPGLGIGLYISSEIIKRHHGTIDVDSQKGKGSTFYFTLPIKKMYGLNVN